MKLISKLLHIDAINSKTGEKVTSIQFLKMIDRNDGKDDLSMHPEDLELLRNNICPPYKLINASIICTEYSGQLVPEEYRF